MNTTQQALSDPAPVIRTRRGFGRQAIALGAAAGILASSVGLANARPAPDSFADLVEEVTPAVVNIATTGVAKSNFGEQGPGAPSFRSPFPENHPFNDFFERFFDPRRFGEGSGRDRSEQPSRKVSGAGSGFIIDADGYVVTNSHVVKDTDEIVITLKDGRKYDARLIGEDPKTDLALLKVDAPAPLPHVSFGDSDAIRVGDWVMTVGNPFGLGGSVTAGIVSARGRDLPGGTLIDFLQIDAPINPGNSGGPAFDSQAQVVGINTAIFSPNGGNVGIGFAIPSNLAAAVIDDLRDDGQVDRSWLGVRIQPVTDDIAKGFGLDEIKGALVAAVEPDSPAASAGVKRGDIILNWNGTEIESVNDLPRAVAFTPVGTTLEVDVWRNRSGKTLSVTTDPQPERLASVPDDGRKPDNAQDGLEHSGALLSDLSPDLRRRFNVDDSVSGVLVTKVKPGSEAAEKNMRPGDIIVSVGLEPVTTLNNLVSKLNALHDQDVRVITLGTVRGQQEMFVALRVAGATG